MRTRSRPPSRTTSPTTSSARARSVESEPNAGKSLWKTYDTIVGPLGALVAKQLVDRLAAADANRPRAGEPKPNPETGKGTK